MSFEPNLFMSSLTQSHWVFLGRLVLSSSIKLHHHSLIIFMFHTSKPSMTTNPAQQISSSFPEEIIGKFQEIFLQHWTLTHLTAGKCLWSGNLNYAPVGISQWSSLPKVLLHKNIHSVQLFTSKSSHMCSNENSVHQETFPGFTRFQ